MKTNGSQRFGCENLSNYLPIMGDDFRHANAPINLLPSCLLIATASSPTVHFAYSSLTCYHSPLPQSWALYIARFTICGLGYNTARRQFLQKRIDVNITHAPHPPFPSPINRHYTPNFIHFCYLYRRDDWVWFWTWALILRTSSTQIDLYDLIIDQLTESYSKHVPFCETAGFNYWLGWPTKHESKQHPNKNANILIIR